MMRFYYLDEGSKVATKCIRVSSTATTNAVIETLIEKFRPDMRMLTVPDYSLYEIHQNGCEFLICSSRFFLPPSNGGENEFLFLLNSS